ncbi:unnamed protein product [Merluccius merluccius]
MLMPSPAAGPFDPSSVNHVIHLYSKLILHQLRGMGDWGKGGVVGVEVVATAMRFLFVLLIPVDTSSSLLQAASGGHV